MSDADVVAMYQGGLSLAEVAAATGLSVSGVVWRLDRAGVQRRPQGATTRRHVTNTARRAALSETVLADYSRGESVLGLSVRHGVARAVIARILRDAGIDVRGRGDAQALRMAHLSPDQRRQLAAPANAARRARGVTDRELVLRAARAESQGHLRALGEREVEVMLRARGLDPVAQLAVGSHNVDLALHPVAVEIHRRTSRPFYNPRLRARADQLVEAGWRVLYVWCRDGVARGPGEVCFTDRCADEVAGHVRLARVDPSRVDPIRVLRCTGEDDAHRAASTGGR